MSRTISLTIPGFAPSKSNSYRIATRRDGTPTLVKGGGGRNHDAGHTVASFENNVLAALLTNRVEPMDGNVTVEALVYPPHDRADVPGVEKVLLDALQNWRWKSSKGSRRKVVNVGGYGAYLNDAQVKRFVVDFGGVDQANPRIVVTVSPWKAPGVSL